MTPADPRAGFTGHSATLCYTSPSDSSFLARLQQFYPPFYVGGVPARGGVKTNPKKGGGKGGDPLTNHNSLSLSLDLAPTFCACRGVNEVLIELPSCRRHPLLLPTGVGWIADAPTSVPPAFVIVRELGQPDLSRIHGPCATDQHARRRLTASRSHLPS